MTFEKQSGNIPQQSRRISGAAATSGDSSDVHHSRTVDLEGDQLITLPDVLLTAAALQDVDSDPLPRADSVQQYNPGVWANYSEDGSLLIPTSDNPCLLDYTTRSSIGQKRDHHLIAIGKPAAHREGVSEVNLATDPCPGEQSWPASNDLSMSSNTYSERGVTNISSHGTARASRIGGHTTLSPQQPSVPRSMKSSHASGSSSASKASNAVATQNPSSRSKKQDSKVESKKKGSNETTKNDKHRRGRALEDHTATTQDRTKHPKGSLPATTSIALPPPQNPDLSFDDLNTQIADDLALETILDSIEHDVQDGHFELTDESLETHIVPPWTEGYDENVALDGDVQLGDDTNVSGHNHHGWVGHNSVFDGGECLACAAAGAEGGFYGPNVRPEDKRH